MGISTEGGGGFRKAGFSTHFESAQRPCESSGSPFNSVLTMAEPELSVRGESVATLHGVEWCNYSTRLSEPRPPGLSRDVRLHSFVSTRTERTSRIYSRERYCPSFHLRKRTHHFCPFRNPNPKMGSMDAYEQVQKGPLKLKGVPELGVTKRKKEKDRDKAKLLQMMGKIQKNQEEELRRHLDKRTPAQVAFEKVQEKRQMERVLKKASTPTGREWRTSTDTWTRSRSTMTSPKSAGPSSRPTQETEYCPGEAGSRVGLISGAFGNILLHTSSGAFC